MRPVLVVCLLLFGCSGKPRAPECSFTPNPAKVTDVYTFRLTNGSPGTAVTLRFFVPDGTLTKRAVVIDNTGIVSIRGVTKVPGVTVAEVAEKDTDDAAVLASCSMQVSDATGCGDGTCGDDESCATCNDDCGLCNAVCGDGLCTDPETCTTCPGDCGDCVACDPEAAATDQAHKPGTVCIDGCHVAGGTAPDWPFTVAGTVYTGPGSTTVVTGATVTVVDADGQTLKLVTTTNGSFFTDKSVRLPLRVGASKCPAVRSMNADVADAGGGDCNGCHKAGSRIYLK